jgi:hypothetical protein
MIDVARKFAQTVLPGVIKPLRVLWNEIVAFLFFLLAVAALPSTYRSAQKFDGDLGDLFRIVMTGTFGLVMLAYGLYSLFRARKIGKS